MDANILEGLDDATRKEVEKLLQVTREKDGNEKFVSAQFKLDEYMFNNKKWRLSINFLKNIRKEDGELLYFKSLYFLFLNNYILGDFKVAYINILEFLKYSDFNADSSSEADSVRKEVFNFAKLFLSKKNYSKSLRLFELIGGSYSYNSKCYENICKLITNGETRIVGELCESLIGKVDAIIDILRLDFLSFFTRRREGSRKKVSTLYRHIHH